MTTTRAESRHRWVRRCAAATVAMALAAGAAGCSGEGTAHAARPPGTAMAPTTTSPTTSAPTAGATTPGKQAHRPAGSTAFAPVVTDRIPAPAVSIALSAPVPGLTNMQPSAARAFGRAFAAARADGLSPQIRSAWRSRAYQQVLFDRAVATYGSAAEAGRWVLAPSRSAHVKGYAVDVHPRAVAVWLEVHGPAYGICRTYDNEWWHFEYLATSHCPPRLPTAAG